MTKKQAENLLADIGKSLTPQDYCEDIYLSIKDVGSKSIKSCSYFETETWVFIWTTSDSFVFDKRDIGDFIFVPSNESSITIEKERTIL